MAYEGSKRETPSASRDGGRATSRGGYFGVGIALIAIVAGLAYVGLRDEPVDGNLVESPVEDARPVGAGTLPDGEADEFNEGLQNETTRDDFIGPGAPTDAFANPLLEGPEADAPTVPSIDQLDPGPAVDDEVLERMAPDTNDEAPATQTDAAESAETEGL